MATPAAALRKFRSREEFRLALGDVYDGYGSASLALWLPAPPGTLPLRGARPSDGPPVVAAWPADDHVESGWVRKDDLDRWLQAETNGWRPEVEIADPSVLEAKATAERLGYSAEIPGQLSGYWFEKDEVEGERPEYDPTGGLLVSPGGDKALDLVQVGHEWRVLSEAAVLTYLHATGIRRGESWVFVSYDAERRPARRLEVVGISSTSPELLEVRFGAAAARRARDDRPSVLLDVRER